MPGPTARRDCMSERDVGAHLPVGQPECGQVQHRPSGDGWWQGDRARHPGPIPVALRVWPCRELQAQQCPPGVCRGPLDGRLLPVARAQQQQRGHRRRGLHLEQIDGQPPLGADEAQDLAGARLKDTGGQVAAGHRATYRLPFLCGALERVGGPGSQHSAGQFFPPDRRTQRPARLLLGHPHDPVVDRDPLRDLDSPAQPAELARSSRPAQPATIPIPWRPAPTYRPSRRIRPSPGITFIASPSAAPNRRSHRTQTTGIFPVSAHTRNVTGCIPRCRAAFDRRSAQHTSLTRVRECSRRWSVRSGASTGP